MIIDPNNPTLPLDKYHNPKKMVNPYGAFHPHSVDMGQAMNAWFVSDHNAAIGGHTKPKHPSNPVDVLKNRIDNSVKDSEYQPYSQKLLKEAYSNIHPRVGVNIGLNYQIRNMARHQIEYYANEAGLYLKRIHDSDYMNLTPENIWNLKDIANPKNHEYFTNKQGRSRITPDDFLDLNGKSDKRINWDANFWQKRSIGNQNNKRQVNNDHDAAHEMQWFNNHAKKYAYYETYPWQNPIEKRMKMSEEQSYMGDWMSKFTRHYRHGSKSWLAKMNLAKGWLTYHQNKLYYYKTYYPDKWTRYGWKPKQRIAAEERYIQQWQKKLGYYTQHKNETYAYYQKYLKNYQQRKYREMMTQHWNEIKSQVHDNTQHHYTSIYCADGMDTRVVRVAEISPTEDTSVNVPVKSVDDGMPQTDWTQISQSQLSGQYTIYLSPEHEISPADTNYGSASPSYNDRVAQYHILKRWAEGGHLLAIQGFNTWDSILLSDIQRSADPQTSANGLQMNLTFTYVRLSHIKYAKNKKAPGRPIRGRHQSSNRSVRIKANNTFSGFAHRYGGTIGEWEHANPHAVARDLPIGGHLNKPKEAK